MAAGDEARRAAMTELMVTRHRQSLYPCFPPSLRPLSQGTTRVMFKIATRGLLGVKNALLTATRGMGVVNTVFDEYRPVAGDLNMRDQGSLVAHETGQVRRKSDAVGRRRALLRSATARNRTCWPARQCPFAVTQRRAPRWRSAHP